MVQRFMAGVRRLLPSRGLLVLAAWLLVALHCLGRPELEGRSLPAAFRVFSPARFKEILDYRTVTSRTYQGLPLAHLNEKVRGSILESLVRRLDQQLHPGSVIRDAVDGQCVNGVRRGRSRLSYGWLRDDVRVQCKSSQITWNKSHAHFIVCFHEVKLNVDEEAPAAFDELLLALYTPRGIFMFRHDLKFGLSRMGINTAVTGSSIVVSSRSGETNWSTALDVILQKLDVSGCERLDFVNLDDKMLLKLAHVGDDCSMQQAYLGLPLSDLSSQARGDCIARLVRSIDSVLHPSCTVDDAAGCDWIRGQDRVECKSSQLCWAKTQRLWRFIFYGVKIQARGIREEAVFDDLLLALYTPKGIYVYRHDQGLGLATHGVRTQIEGHVIQIYGPSGVEDWRSALDAVLAKLDAGTNGCQRLAFVPLRRMM
ncbi:unnamed protein product [Polarella glacialis]|uniref:Uncharacterized protein n=1 Tax=Polarella glacialis TaxID=89957 RepID=A0A813ILM4_POLGL|nr:unnamed protein product [Polarella glacialis]